MNAFFITFYLAQISGQKKRITSLDNRNIQMQMKVFIPKFVLFVLYFLLVLWHLY